MSKIVPQPRGSKELEPQTFQSLGNKLQAPFLNALNDMGYEFMSPVQQKVLTELPKNSCECLVQAKTGTGKTIAFLLPALQSLLSGQSVPRGQVGILIMSPTRELAIQIGKECDLLTARLPQRIECHTAYGGSQKASNLQKFMRGDPKVLVATPGRLNDYLGEEAVRVKFRNIRTIILDEADRMLDQGFLPDIKQVLRSLPPKKEGWQGMCFSATVPPKVKDVVSVVLNPGYTHLSTINVGEAPTIATVPQYSVIVPQMKDTFNALCALLKAEYEANPIDFKTIIFGTTAKGVAIMHELFTLLAPKMLPGLKIYQLHSRLSQSARTRTTEEFKVATSGLMFASDVIGRGMDFPNVGLVIQVGLPSEADQYIHRVGRTARAGKDGRAVILLTNAESFFTKYEVTLPINPYPVDILPRALQLAPDVASAFDRIDLATKTKAYQAFLGFNMSFVKKMGINLGRFVAIANEYADAMQCPETPMIDKKLVQKMGLKGVDGLNIGHVQRDLPPRRPQKKDGSKGEIVKSPWATDDLSRGGFAPTSSRSGPAGRGSVGQDRGRSGQKRRGGAANNDRASKR